MTAQPEHKASPGGLSAVLSGAGRYSDIILAMGVVMIVGLMILPLPLLVIDILVAVNILLSVGLLLLAIYVPSPIAFSSFPSVILLSTLFRLSLSIAITRLILLDADAGAIIETFGRLVVGGNLIVGIVVFIIITVVQFIVIAKGSERVAEVAARFTLDAMPGKQLSIDSDLRSGLIDKEQAKQKRHFLELESQLHGSLDGAMKFVKGDAIAGIVILIVNILAGLAIGVLQNDMPLGEAVHTYSILTIGDGLVAQVPALLTSISAGLIITRTAGNENDSHLGEAITRQVTAHPRVVTIGGIIALLLTLVPGFPWPVFLVIGIALLSRSVWRALPANRHRMEQAAREAASETATPEAIALTPPRPVQLTVDRRLLDSIDEQRLNDLIESVSQTIEREYGVPMPRAVPQAIDRAAQFCRLEAHGITLYAGDPLATKDTNSDAVPRLISPSLSQTTHTDEEAAFSGVLYNALCRHLGLFMGIQETSNLLNSWNREYPDLIKEILRVVPPQKLTDVLRRLLNENISIRNLRDVFEAITDVGSREKDVVMLTEQVRMSLKRHISHRFTNENRSMRAILVHPELEENLRQAIRESGQQGAQGVSLPPESLKQLQRQITDLTRNQPDRDSPLVMLCSVDVRRHLRRLLEEDHHGLPVLSFQELAGDIQVDPIGRIGAEA
ncbi:FHIPEP family type III secretion protein [Saccharospirillum salsuginis]|uniref:EscV/YscV/HrcV family type III secretion system export apparatus protein n=1 Tax=Saccharospirillum salsuginis TaxID=418750 RepID=A0A918NJJ4_9GAMM|nr:FHIPEP family type III secretion protein [Saccharospirillum salsuginis]GGX75366.1 EscV/YscV/HrcV family type III secretion system export apparatus protein [Saccharospirillum salsuginis]